MEEKVNKTPEITEADGYDGKWHGSQLEAKSSPVIDPYTGESLIIRSFVFAWNPENKKAISKQALFSSHERQIKEILKHDGWTAYEDIPPRLEVSKNKKYYTIFVVCKPRWTKAGMKEMVNERPLTLNEYINAKPNSK